MPQDCLFSLFKSIKVSKPSEWTFFCDCLSQICQFKQVQNLGRLSKITHKLRWVVESARLGAFVNINSDNFIFYLFSSSHGFPWQPFLMNFLFFFHGCQIYHQRPRTRRRCNQILQLRRIWLAVRNWGCDSDTRRLLSAHWCGGRGEVGGAKVMCNVNTSMILYTAHACVARSE